jgi:Tfp pilus assembly protein PilO
MLRQLKLQKSDLVIMAVMGLAIIGIGYLIYNNAGQIAQVTADRKGKEAELARIHAKVANFGKLRAEVAANEAEMQRIATYIPDEEGQAGFITELSRLTVGSGVKFKSCQASEKPTPFTDLPEYLVYRWDVNFEAVYPQLLNFLETLPAQERSTLVSKVNISAGKPGAGAGSLSPYALNVRLTLDLISKAKPKAGPSQPVARNGAKKVSQ